MTDQEKVKVLRDGISSIMANVPSGTRIHEICTKTIGDAYELGQRHKSFIDSMALPIELPKPPADIPFSIEAAQRGEKVQAFCRGDNGDVWEDVQFIGVTVESYPVIERIHARINIYTRIYAVSKLNQLRMAPKKMRKMYLQCYFAGGGIRCTNPYDTKEEAINIANCPPKPNLIGDPIEIEVPDTRK